MHVNDTHISCRGGSKARGPGAGRQQSGLSQLNFSWGRFCVLAFVRTPEFTHPVLEQTRVASCVIFVGYAATNFSFQNTNKCLDFFVDGERSSLESFTCPTGTGKSKTNRPANRANVHACKSEPSLSLGRKKGTNLSFCGCSRNYVKVKIKVVGSIVILWG